ncbi:ABC transporter permease [Halorussus halobius]|uniref:ABC transporter permease n=1 Tax=Halorussus halobius TaxID=1710537 RepID=UPI00109242C4|nr:ABC transporter permease [Halorussus halobius]
MPEDTDTDWRLPDTVDGRSATIGAVLLVALVAAAAWYFRPWLQGLVYLVYSTPIVVVAVVVTALIYLALVRSGVPVGVNAAGVTFVAILIVGSGVGGLLADETLGTRTMVDATETSNLSEVDADRPRIVTQSVSQRYASNTLNFPQYRLAGSDITVHNGTPHWSYALAPDGTWNHFTKQQHGTVMVDMTRQNTRTKTFTGDLEKGIGTSFYNNYKWHVIKNGEFLVNYQDPFMVVHDDEQYVAVPYTKPTFHWTPLPYTTPEWGGVVLVDEDGNVEDLSPSAARAHPVLDEQKLYPFSLARQRVASTKYRNGILNTFTSHEDEIELAPVPGDNNDQPFAVFTEDGPELLVAVEPYGDAQGLKEVWTVDGRTGEYSRYSPEQSLFGPRKATDYVRQAARTTDWNRFVPSEPIPVVVDGTLYWEVRVVPEDSSGIAYIAFVDAESSDVVEVDESDAVRAFLRGESVPDANATDGGDERDPAMVVQRVAENGTVLDTLEIFDDESIEIRRGNETASGR